MAYEAFDSEILHIIGNAIDEACPRDGLFRAS
jgi:hypothetical protein